MRRRQVFRLLWLLAALGLGEAALWYGAVLRLEAGFRAWEAQARGQGWQVTHRPLAAGGWPLRAQVRVPALAVAAPGVLLRADAVLLRLAFAHPRSLEVAAPGHSAFRALGVGLDLVAGRLAVRAPLFGARQPLARLQAEALRLAARPSAPPLVIARLDARIAETPGVGLALSAQARGLALPRGPFLPRGGAIDEARLAATLNPPPARAASAAAAAAWRAAGGQAAVGSLRLRAGALALALTLRLHLDSALQPAGTGTALVEGAAGALTRAGVSGALPAGTVTALKAMLSLLGDTGASGTADRVRLPLGLHGGLLTLGGLPILKVPPLVWPQS